MNEQNFLDNYLWPSDDKLDRTFTHPLPNIEGLQKCGNFIVQSEFENTFSTNIMAKYVSDTLGIRLVELYKNSQNKVTGFFVRLVGTMSILKKGYPRASLDGAVSNVRLRAIEGAEPDAVEKIITRVTIHLPQADSKQRRIFFNHLGEQAKEAGIPYIENKFNTAPDFLGVSWQSETKGTNLDVIKTLRDYLWNSYQLVIEQTKEKIPFDYRPAQEYMIFDIAELENQLFEGKGLTVPAEIQSAFFSVMVCSI
jgi:hypothetical protein